MISPTNYSGSGFPPEYIPTELDYSQRDDAHGAVQRSADDFDERRSVEHHGVGAGGGVDHSHDTTVVMQMPISLEEQDTENTGTSVGDGTEALPIPDEDADTLSLESGVSAGLGAAVMLAILLVAFIAEMRASNKLNCALVREQIVKALVTIAGLMKMGALAQGIGGIVQGGLGVGGAGVSASFLRGGNGSPAGGVKTTKLDDFDSSPGTSGRKDVSVEGAGGELDQLNKTVRDADRADGVDAADDLFDFEIGRAGDRDGVYKAGQPGMPGMDSTEIVGNRRGQSGDPNAAWNTGHAGMPGMDGVARKGLAGDPDGIWNASGTGMPGMEGAGGASRTGLVGDPDGVWSPGKRGMPGMDGLVANPQGRYGAGRSGAPGMDDTSSTSNKGLAGNPDGAYGPANADMPGMRRTSGADGDGLAGDPNIDWSDVSTGRPGMPGMEPNSSGRSGIRNGSGADGIDINQQQRDRGTASDQIDGVEGAAGGADSTNFKSSEEWATEGGDGAPRTRQENWNQDWGVDPNAKRQANTAKSQACSQGVAGLSGIASAGGGLGSGLYSESQKLEEAAIENNRGSMDGLDSLNGNFQDTMGNLARMAQEIAQSERSSMARIMG